ncbi:MAG: hypothetical protein FJW34_00095 [Acidobacteria bacterium]|nr:hypothetical protein [Acidobacteriota bacterium]
MPWKARDAPRHTRKADTAGKRALWSDVANQTLARTGSEGRAVRAANAVIARIRGDVRKSRKR